MTILDVVDLYKSYGAQPVLAGLDLSVERGSFSAILGPSGSGKTTLLRSIAGFERADRGSIRIAGTVVDDGEHFVSPDRRHIGYVPQEGCLFPHLTVEKNIGFGIARRERTGKRVQELIEMVGLTGLGRRYPHQLSGGEQQRVALARALAIEPDLVLLDEPFSSLDATLRASVRNDVHRVLRDAGTTALLVTHDQDEALSLADHVAIIRDGHIGQLDTPQGLYVRPRSPDLARSLGESNLLEGVVSNGSVTTPFGVLRLEDSDFAEGTKLSVLLRPEQIELHHDLKNVPVRGCVVAREFYGHDSVIRVRPEWDSTMTIVVRISGASSDFVVGATVGLSARGSVTGWRTAAE